MAPAGGEGSYQEQSGGGRGKGGGGLVWQYGGLLSCSYTALFEEENNEIDKEKDLREAPRKDFRCSTGILP